MSDSSCKTEKVILVDVKQLTDLINERSKNDEQKKYLKQRWLHQIQWWDERAWEARGRYFALRSTIILGGVLVPFLTVISFDDDPVKPWLRGAAAAVGLIVAAAVGLEALYGYGSIWLEKRKAAELLKIEGWSFLFESGVYKCLSEEEGFQCFVNRVENRIAAEVGEYVTNAREAQSKSGQSTEPTHTPPKPDPG